MEYKYSDIGAGRNPDYVAAPDDRDNIDSMVGGVNKSSMVTSGYGPIDRNNQNRLGMNNDG